MEVEGGGKDGRGKEGGREEKGSDANTTIVS
jgi:hypothetical protein